MLIYHITSLKAAYNIITSNHFQPLATQKLDAIYLHDDDCLNCFCFDKQYYTKQKFTNNGVKLIMEWKGKKQKFVDGVKKPYTPNILYDQHPWRCFIPINTNKELLRVVRIDFEPNTLDLMYHTSLMYKLLPRFISKQYFKIQKYIFLKSIRNIYRNNDCFIKIY